MKLRAWLSFWIVGAGLLLVGCGGEGSPKSTAPAGSALAGNWLIVGPMPTSGLFLNQPTGFRLAMTFDVNGNTVTAAGSGNNSCGDAGLSFGFASVATGTIAADGSFNLQNPTNLPTSFPIGSISIDGKVPAASGSPWPGSYTATITVPTLGTSGSTCVSNLAGTFTATSFPLVSGSYAGTATGQTIVNGVPVTSAISVEVVLQQGGTVTSPATGLPFTSNTVLTGSIAVQGSPCFTSGVTTSTPASAVDGNEIVAAFTMNDGSTVELEGRLTDSTESTISTDVLLVLSGPCTKSPSLYQLPELDRQS